MGLGGEAVEASFSARLIPLPTRRIRSHHGIPINLALSIAILTVATLPATSRTADACRRFAHPRRVIGIMTARESERRLESKYGYRGDTGEQ
jgi:hypothetical protein